MSYEGYRQSLCKNGHYSEDNCYYGTNECVICKSPFVWWNDVDTTNGDGKKYHVELEVLEDPHCDKCGQSTGIATFKIPKKKGKGKKENAKQRKSNR